MEHFEFMETTISKVHQAYLDGSLTAVQLVKTYLQRTGDQFDHLCQSEHFGRGSGRRCLSEGTSCSVWPPAWDPGDAER